MAWSMPGRRRSTSQVTRWGTPPPTLATEARIDAPTAADLLNRRTGPPPVDQPAGD